MWQTNIMSMFLNPAEEMGTQAPERDCVQGREGAVWKCLMLRWLPWIADVLLGSSKHPLLFCDSALLSVHPVCFVIVLLDT